MTVPVLALRPPLFDAPAGAREGVVPLDPPRAHASGPAPYRLLVVGGGLVAGHGVTTFELALGGVVAREFSRLVGHGADAETVVLDRPNDLGALGRTLRRRDLSRTDALVVVLDPQDRPLVTGEFARRLNGLVADLVPRTAETAGLTIVIPADSRGDLTVSAFSEIVRAGTGGFARVVALEPTPEEAGPRQRFAVWGTAIAEAVAARAISPIVWDAPVEPLDDRTRVTAQRRLGPFDAEWEAMLHRLVEQAARAYGAGSAAVSIVGGKRVEYLAGHGVTRSSLPREETICDTALRTYGGVIVGDAQSDDRFKDVPLVRRGDVRFYAGHRIDSPDGQPIAVLCVFDDEPRSVRGQDITLLRDFAYIAERRIRDHALASRA